MAKPRKIFKPRKIIVPENCLFCKTDKEPHYLEVETLAKFTTERGKILAKDRNGLCAKHQRALARAVKRARHLALLPFVTQIK